LRAINALVTKLEHAERKVDEYQRTIGQHIAAIKKARPDDWQEVVEAKCKLERALRRLGSEPAAISEVVYKIIRAYLQAARELYRILVAVALAMVCGDSDRADFAEGSTRVTAAMLDPPPVVQAVTQMLVS
jgi:hypothetical protein